MKAILKNAYISLTKGIDSGLLGIFFGIVSSVAINIATSEKMEGAPLRVVYHCIISMVCIFIIMRRRQKMEKEAASLGTMGTDYERWQAAADLGSLLTVALYLLSFVCAIGFCLAAVIEMVHFNAAK